VLLSCKEASELISLALDHPLPIGKRLLVRIHLVICRLCSNYRRQLQFLHRIIRDFPEHIDVVETDTALSGEAKQRIRTALYPHD
jgi:hypothetical protein